MKNYIVFDLEWNQGEAPVTENGKTLIFEIIEIGAVKLNEKKEKVGEFSRLIKPQVFKQMHRITGKLIRAVIFEVCCEDLVDNLLEIIFVFMSPASVLTVSIKVLVDELIKVQFAHEFLY